MTQITLEFSIYCKSLLHNPNFQEVDPQHILFVVFQWYKYIGKLLNTKEGHMLTIVEIKQKFPNRYI